MSPEVLRDAQLKTVTYLGPSINLYEFRMMDGLPLDHQGPGCHIDLHFPDGAVRQYSLTTLRDDACVIAVRRESEGRGASLYLHDKARVGDRFKLGTCRNLFPLAGDAAHSVLIAGGIGITPLLPMLEDLHRHSRSWELHYASRDEEPAFRASLRKYGDAVHYWSGSAPGPRRLDIPRLVQASPAGSTFYCCGPEKMISAFATATAGLPEGKARFERFHPVETVAADGGFMVTLARQKRSLAVAAGQSILECLVQAGVNVRNSCMQGICGVCETRVLGGRPDHRDSILSAAERAANDTMLICCSGSLDATLVLDL